MLAHFVLCAIVRFRLAGSPAIDNLLFATPIGGPPFIRLLRLQYYWPYLSIPENARLMDPWTAGMLAAARYAGFGSFCAITAMFVAIFIEASH